MGNLLEATNVIESTVASHRDLPRNVSLGPPFVKRRSADNPCQGSEKSPQGNKKGARDFRKLERELVG
jgi:hypothetical protein